METIRIVSIIAKEDERWKMMPWNEHNSIRSNHLYTFQNSFGDPCPLCKYDTLKNNSYCLLHNLLYMDINFIYLHSTLCKYVTLKNNSYWLLHNLLYMDINFMYLHST
jgi:hypothetical protein